MATTTFKKVLIANRGEIACRIIRTLKRMGIAAVAVYSDADRDAMHVAIADEAVRIGEAHPLKSYLDQEAILGAIRTTGADAVHPGYGFLSENAAFARAIIAAGAAWIGPHPDAIDAMGNKQRARAIMGAAGVPLVPGADADDAEQAKARASEIGYPVMLKAALGGGGIGMQIVYDESDLAEAWATAATRAARSFGDSVIYLEKYIEEPHHVEIQVFGDKHGNIVHLFERECSLQRRHQKVAEECPSPMLSNETRRRMVAAAVDGARNIGYDNAGTLEFLVDKFQNFYFLEMNTRLQVEHPVTEMVTGLDLVEWQLRAASGEPLPLAQDGIALNGHAIEVRIYAEKPKNFMPAPGTIATLHWPEDGSRIDTGVRAGDTITPFYDPMIAKLIVHAATRDDALVRLADALEHTTITGLHTNLPFLGEVVADPEFRMGNYTTHLIHKLRPKL